MKHNSTTASRVSAHVSENRRHWDAMAHTWVDAGERSWAQADPTWGIWGLAEADLQMLPQDMHTQHAIELGCGTAYVSAWMARRGARVFALDNSARQLATAARLKAQHGLAIDFVHASAEQIPCKDAQFDFAISEYGAAIWCDPLVWIAQAHRVLKPGGRLTFLGTHPLVHVATSANGDLCETQLHRPYFGMHTQDWRNVEINPGGIEFNLPLSRWLQLFRETGFEVLNYQELQAPPGSTASFGIPAAWARNWPAEQVWQLLKV